MSFGLLLLAGLMNGSFTIPLLFIKYPNKQRVWLIYSFLGLVIMPWIILGVFLRIPISAYLHLSHYTIMLLIIGGLLFGIGQACFASAIEKLGIALAFSINLSIGTVIGTLFALFYQQKILSIQHLLVMIAVVLIISALINYYFIGKKSRTNYEDTIRQKRLYRTGWILALFAGIASGCQNIAFILALHTEITLKAVNAFWVWPPFLFAASIPMMLNFYYYSTKIPVSSRIKFSDFFAIFIMGLFFTGSLGLYSLAMGDLSQTQQVIGWPLFMIAIILTSQLWGLVSNEFIFNKTGTKFRLSLNIFMLIIAILILAMAK